jgi:CheY-like chemotaxis protein
MNSDFLSLTRSAYEHIYDLIYLRTHPLLAYLPISPERDANEQAWQLHHLLLETIQELDPGPKAPVFSREWRRYRLLTRHFEDGLDPQEVAKELNISRRQYYREYNAAMQTLALILAGRLALTPVETSSDNPQILPSLRAQQETARQEILRSEAARAAAGNCTAELSEIISGAQHLVKGIFQANRLATALDIPADLPPVSVNPGLLRQLLLSVLGFVGKECHNADVQIQAQVLENQVELHLTLCPHQKLAVPDPQPWQEISALGDYRINFDPSGKSPLFSLTMPIANRRTILVVDDNTDIIELYRRYLNANQFHVIAESDAHRVSELAIQWQPFAILLDLMMPGADGWDTLQILTNSPETHTIPVIVCSILPQKELALSLGAVSFLQKPISENALVGALEKLNCA